MFRTLLKTVPMLKTVPKSTMSDDARGPVSPRAVC